MQQPTKVRGVVIESLPHIPFWLSVALGVLCYVSQRRLGKRFEPRWKHILLNGINWVVQGAVQVIGFLWAWQSWGLTTTIIVTVLGLLLLLWLHRAGKRLQAKKAQAQREAQASSVPTNTP